MTERAEILYKYLNPERLDVVASLRIRITQRPALNDPYECTVGLDEERIRVLVRDTMGQVVPNLPWLRKLFTSDDQLNDVMRETLTNMNAMPIFKDEIVQSGLYDRLDREFGVLSLSTSPVSPRLWALYALGHQGFCVGFHRGSDMFASAEGADFARLVAVSYEDRPPNMPLPPLFSAAAPPMNQEAAIRVFFGSKSLAWADEREVRLVKSTRASGLIDIGPDTGGCPVLLGSIPPDAIACIVLGARASKELEARLRQHCLDHGINPKFQRARVPIGSYEIEVVDG